LANDVTSCWASISPVINARSVTERYRFALATVKDLLPVVKLVIVGAVSSPGALNASTGWIWRLRLAMEERSEGSATSREELSASSAPLFGTKSPSLPGCRCAAR
jgi:hypothetical protein